MLAQEAEMQKQLTKAIVWAFDKSGANKMVSATMKRIDSEVFKKALGWMKTTAEKGASAVKDALEAAKASEAGKAVMRGAECLSTAIDCLGPLTAALSFAISISTLIADIASGSGVAQAVLDSLNIVVDAAMVVMAIVDIAIEAAAVTVIGIVFVCVALAITAVIAIVSLILQLIQPESPQDEYMHGVVRPFLAMLPQAVPAPVEKRIAKHATKLNAAWRGQAFEHQTATA
jgi:hypothetical protein